MISFDLNILKKHKVWYNLIKKKKFGKKIGNKIFLSIYEFFYLYEHRISNKSYKKVEKWLNKYLANYLVFKDLVDRGFVVKTALKYGFNFRVYKKEDFEKGEHSLYLVKVICEDDVIKSKELISQFRVANSVRKRILLAFVDEEGSIIYYEAKWLRI